MTDREAVLVLRKALHDYMFALTARTQGVAHKLAEDAMRKVDAHLGENKL